MYAEMDRVFTITSFQPSQTNLFWYDMFSSLHVLLGIKGYKNSHECLYFDVLPSRRLHSLFVEDEIVTQGNMLPISILWKKDKKYMLNPHPNDINNLSELWVYENKPIDKLLWDPNDISTYQHINISTFVEMAKHINTRNVRQANPIFSILGKNG